MQRLGILLERRFSGNSEGASSRFVRGFLATSVLYCTGPTDMMNEMTATGGILLIGIGISSMLGLKQIRVGNFLPALAIAPFIIYVMGLVMK